jgi:ribose transport system ATP-binding protein
LIAGVLPPSAGAGALLGGPAGSPEIGASVAAGLGYVPGERLAEGMIAPFSVAWNISPGSGGDRATTRLGFWRTRREIQVAKDYIESLRIRSAQPDTACARLSGGNQQKVVLSRDPGVLVLDNPTRGVDAGTKEEIYRVIRDLTDKGVGVMLITDEVLELIGLSKRMLIIQHGQVVTEIDAPPHAKPTERELVAWMMPGNPVDRHPTQCNTKKVAACARSSSTGRRRCARPQPWEHARRRPGKAFGCPGSLSWR